jgi:hypothetical protein
MCFLDTITVVSQFYYYMFRGDSARDALRRILRGRFVDGGPDGGDGMASIDRNRVARFVFFAFSALPLVVKLYTLRGIFWTKVWASMYLLSFVAIETLVWLSKPYEQVLHLGELEDDFFYRDFSVTRHYLRSVKLLEYLQTVLVLLMIVSLSTIFLTRFFENSTSYFKYTTTSALVLIIASILHESLLQSLEVGVETESNRPPHETFISFIGLNYYSMLYMPMVYLETLYPNVFVKDELMFAHVILLMVSNYYNYTARGSQHIRGYIRAYRGYIILIALSYAIAFVLQWIAERELPSMEFFTYIIILISIMCIILLVSPLHLKYQYPIFALHHLAYALLYYSHSYDPVGTVNPPLTQIWG